MGKDW